MPDKYVKGMKQRPGDMAGEPCEGPGTDGNGCERTESSRWLAAGRCCTAIKCQQFFRVGKYSSGAAAAKAKADVDVQRVHTPSTPISPAALAATARVNAKAAAEQPPAPDSAGVTPSKNKERRAKRLVAGSTLLPLQGSYNDGRNDAKDNTFLCDHDPWGDDARAYAGLTRPRVLNVRREPEYDEERMCIRALWGQHSFLIEGSFVYGECMNDQYGEFTRWVSLRHYDESQDPGGFISQETWDQIIALMEANNAHPKDVALLRGDGPKEDLHEGARERDASGQWISWKPINPYLHSECCFRGPFGSCYYDVDV